MTAASKTHDLRGGPPREGCQDDDPWCHKQVAGPGCGQPPHLTLHHVHAKNHVRRAAVADAVWHGSKARHGFDC